MKFGSLLGFLLFASAFCSMKLMLTADEEALCLDGSKGVLYFNKLVFLLRSWKWIWFEEVDYIFSRRRLDRWKQLKLNIEFCILKIGNIFGIFKWFECGSNFKWNF